MIISLILLVLAIYFCCGFVFALAFIFKGVQVVDKGAHESGIGFRIIIFPGTLVLWPLLLNKWIKDSKNQLHD